jgi:hypothetical protein
MTRPRVFDSQGAKVEADKRRQHAEREATALQGMLDSTLLMLQQDAQVRSLVFNDFYFLYLF